MSWSRRNEIYVASHCEINCVVSVGIDEDEEEEEEEE